MTTHVRVVRYVLAHNDGFQSFSRSDVYVSKLCFIVFTFLYRLRFIETHCQNRIHTWLKLIYIILTEILILKMAIIEKELSESFLQICRIFFRFKNSLLFTDKNLHTGDMPYKRVRLNGITIFVKTSHCCFINAYHARHNFSMFSERSRRSGGL